MSFTDARCTLTGVLVLLTMKSLVISIIHDVLVRYVSKRCRLELINHIYTVLNIVILILNPYFWFLVNLRTISYLL